MSTLKILQEPLQNKQRTIFLFRLLEAITKGPIIFRRSSKQGFISTQGCISVKLFAYVLCVPNCKLTTNKLLFKIVVTWIVSQVHLLCHPPNLAAKTIVSGSVIFVMKDFFTFTDDLSETIQGSALFTMLPRQVFFICVCL